MSTYHQQDIVRLNLFELKILLDWSLESNSTLLHSNHFLIPGQVTHQRKFSHRKPKSETNRLSSTKSE